MRTLLTYHDKQYFDDRAGEKFIYESGAMLRIGTIELHNGQWWLTPQLEDNPQWRGEPTQTKATSTRTIAVVETTGLKVIHSAATPETLHLFTEGHIEHLGARAVFDRFIGCRWGRLKSHKCYCMYYWNDINNLRIL